MVAATLGGNCVDSRGGVISNDGGGMLSPMMAGTLNTVKIGKRLDRPGWKWFDRFRTEKA